MIKYLSKRLVAAVWWLVLTVLAAMISASPIVRSLGEFIWDDDCDPNFLAAAQCQSSPIVA